MSSARTDLQRERVRAWMGRGSERVAALDESPAGHWVILRALPAALSRRFDRDSARGLDAILELRVRNPQGGRPTTLTLIIAGGALTVRPGHNDAAHAGAEVSAGDMIRLVSGTVGWPELLASRRLEMFGDPFLALRFPTMFRLPASAL
jgi:hypothetical protein